MNRVMQVLSIHHLKDSGLIEWHGNSLTVPMSGRLLVRRVAMAFDRHLRESLTRGNYSKVV